MREKNTRLIQSDEEFDRLAAEFEALDTIEESRDLDAQEQELQALLAHLCSEYEDRTVARRLLFRLRY